MSAPTINGAINGGTDPDHRQLQPGRRHRLANQLKYGALPLTFPGHRAVHLHGAGQRAARAGLIAGAIGIALVFIYALLYYRLLGLVMIASLILSAVVVYASLVLLGRQIGFTLSLAGIAGFIVAIGITADSFVVYFERLKDEVREGRSLRQRRPAGLGPRPPDDPVRRRGQLPGRRDPLLAGDRRREGLRVHAGPVHGPGPGHRLPLHPPVDGGAQPVKSFGTNRFSGLGRVDHSRRPAAPARDRDLVGAGSSPNGSNR